jgi:hypothetical protein
MNVVTFLLLFCAFACLSLLLLATAVALLAAIDLRDLLYPVFALGLLALLPASFVLAARLSHRLFPPSRM